MFKILPTANISQTITSHTPSTRDESKIMSTYLIMYTAGNSKKKANKHY
jgi:hypothetical protein